MQLHSPYINSSKKYMKKRETEKNNQITNISKKQHMLADRLTDILHTYIQYTLIAIPCTPAKAK